MHRNRDTHLRREIETEGNSTSNATLSSAVRANDHVQVRAGAELDMVIRDEVVQPNAHNGPWDIAGILQSGLRGIVQ